MSKISMNPNLTFKMPLDNTSINGIWAKASPENYFYISPDGGLGSSEIVMEASDSTIDLMIPYVVNGIKVKSIGDPSNSYGTLSYCTSLRSVSIPYGVTAIYNGGFASCTNLTSIEIPDSVVNIGMMAFQHCNSLKSIILPKDMSLIAMATFYYCTSLTSIDIHSKIIGIVSDAFYGCDGIIINIHKPKDSIENAPWGAKNATINWLG